MSICLQAKIVTSLCIAFCILYVDVLFISFSRIRTFVALVIKECELSSTFQETFPTTTTLTPLNPNLQWFSEATTHFVWRQIEILSAAVSLSPLTLVASNSFFIQGRGGDRFWLSHFKFSTSFKFKRLKCVQTPPSIGFL